MRWEMVSDKKNPNFISFLSIIHTIASMRDWSTFRILHKVACQVAGGDIHMGTFYL